MGRRPNYSPEFKLKCVQEYLNGKSYRQVARENHLINVRYTSIKRWVDKYLQNGSAAFEYIPLNTNYSDDLKQKAIQDYLNHQGSYEQIALKYGISSGAVLRYWVLAHNVGLQTEETDMNNMEDRLKPSERRKAMKFSQEQKTEAVHWCVAHNRNYQETADRYGCSYQQIYTWCSKVENDGVHALEDRRGKRKPQELLSSDEQLRKENEELRKENEILKRQAELLKKLNQKGRRW